MQFNVRDEYGVLKMALVASVDNFYPHEIINETQKYYYPANPPNLITMKLQQKKFWEILKDFGVELIIAKSMEDCPQQIFTRDIAFVIGDTLFISNMNKPLRKGEREGIKEIIEKAPNKVFLEHRAEGGDFILNDNEIYIGISQRTTERSVDEVKRHLIDNFECIPIFLKEGFLHLDTVFNIISKKHAIVCKDAIHEESIKKLEKFDLIEVNSKEQFDLNTNIINLAPDTLVVQPVNERLNGELRRRGFNLMETEYSEITKMGGSFRCSICPILRK